MNKRTLVLGASSNESRYSNIASKMLQEYHHTVIPVGNKSGKIGDLEIMVVPPIEKNIHTITLYLNPSRQEAYFSYILALNPQRIIFNPGTENVTLSQLANEHGIETIEACTLVMLRTGQY